MAPVVEVLDEGFLTTVQDLGRRGYQHLGFSVGGAVDSRSLVLANYLVGNSGSSAGLEATVQGPRLRFADRAVVAVVGANPQVLVNGSPVPSCQTLVLNPGSELAIPSMRGARAYVAIGGGLSVPEVLGSRSTDLVAGIGGLDGRRLRFGDALQTGRHRSPVRALRVRPAFEPVAGERLHVLFSAGPQHHLLTDELSQFTGQVFEVASESDRMGIRLNGTAIKGKRRQILSEGQPAGAIQLPGGGVPIVLLAGRQSVGGYPKLGVVGLRGLADLGQALPSVKVSFELADPGESAAATVRWLRTLATPALVTEPCLPKP